MKAFRCRSGKRVDLMRQALRSPYQGRGKFGILEVKGLEARR